MENRNMAEAAYLEVEQFAGGTEVHSSLSANALPFVPHESYPNVAHQDQKKPKRFSKPTQQANYNGEVERESYDHMQTDKRRNFPRRGGKKSYSSEHNEPGRARQGSNRGGRAAKQFSYQGNRYGPQRQEGSQMPYVNYRHNQDRQYSEYHHNQDRQYSDNHHNQDRQYSDNHHNQDRQYSDNHHNQDRQYSDNHHNQDSQYSDSHHNQDRRYSDYHHNQDRRYSEYHHNQDRRYSDNHHNQDKRYSEYHHNQDRKYSEFGSWADRRQQSNRESGNRSLDHEHPQRYSANRNYRENRGTRGNDKSHYNSHQTGNSRDNSYSVQTKPNSYSSRRPRNGEFERLDYNAEYNDCPPRNFDRGGRGRGKYRGRGGYKNRNAFEEDYTYQSENHTGSASNYNGNVGLNEDMACAPASGATAIPSLMDQNFEELSPFGEVIPKKESERADSHRKKDFVQKKNESVVNKRNTAPVKGNIEKPSKDKAENQRGVLIEQLSNGVYECMVCFCVIRRDVAVWNCPNCYHVFHLHCIKKWGKVSLQTVKNAEGNPGWLCPACQKVYVDLPQQYVCFCGKVTEPASSGYETPHSCGEVCGKDRGSDCTHPCNILCHPGPCPPCTSIVNRSCHCGKSNLRVRCGQNLQPACEANCEKLLNCGKHQCAEPCHSGSCQPCAVIIKQVCHCGQEERDVLCGSTESFSPSFSCQKTCNRDLDCGNHKCDQPCHPGDCDLCPLAPGRLQFCPCLKTPLAELADDREARQSCTDPVPTCDKTCEKDLPCGPPDHPHHCQAKCHTSPCPPCTQNTSLQCRCGALTKQVECKELNKKGQGSSNFLCNKRCSKKMNCGRHKCSKQCCKDMFHVCEVVCNRKLSCGKHRCKETCHTGNCQRCYQASFDELRCHCGYSVIFPPVPCGTKPPECNQPCQREHGCNHDVLHQCHSADKCPPCAALTERTCMGGHEKRKNVPCHLQDISCGKECGRPLPCGLHRCKKLCHKGSCLKDGKPCNQPCPKTRPRCGHRCLAPCHGNKVDLCPVTPCRVEMTVKCECGLQTSRLPCHEAVEEEQSQKMKKMVVSGMSSAIREGQSIDISYLTEQRKLKVLDCTSECSLRERNRRLAEALDITNPDLSSSSSSEVMPPQYSDFLKDYARKNSTFAKMVEQKFDELIQSCQNTAQKKSRRHPFPPMKNDQRRFIHELAEVYHLQSQAYDEEPKRNVVVTATKVESRVPSALLTSFIKIVTKGPVPIPHRNSENDCKAAVKNSQTKTGLPQTPSFTTLTSAKSLSNQLSDLHTSSSTPDMASTDGWVTMKKKSHRRNNAADREAFASHTSQPMKPSVFPTTDIVDNPSDSVSMTGGAFAALRICDSRDEIITASSSSKTKEKSAPVIDYFDMTE